MRDVFGLNIIEYLLIIALVYGLYRLGRNRNSQSIAITRRRICLAAYGSRILRPLAFIALIGGILTLALIGGRFSPVVYAVSLLIACAYPGWYLRKMLSLYRKPLLSILKRLPVDIESELEGKKLTRSGSLLYYCDKNWFIAVGGGCCALLYAPMIDFSKEPRHHIYQFATTNFKTGSRIVDIHMQIFYDANENELIASGTCFNEELQQWFASHRR